MTLLTPPELCRQKAFNVNVDVVIENQELLQNQELYIVETIYRTIDTLNDNVINKKSSSYNDLSKLNENFPKIKKKIRVGLIRNTKNTRCLHIV